MLGSFRVSRDGQEVDLGPRLQRALLAILVVEAGHVVPVDRLIDLLRRAAEPGKHRMPTRPTAASRERRREAKLARGRTKRLRQPIARSVDT